VFLRNVCIGLLMLMPVGTMAQAKLKVESQRVVAGETLHYKARWGVLTIGSASTRIDKTLYNVGTNTCYKVDINGQTNGLAKLFYVKDSWTAYIDTATITTHQSYRSICEGSYELDEQIRFDQPNKKAEVKVYDKKTKTYVLKKIYDTHDNVRDVIAGVMTFRLVDLSRYRKGDTFTVNGFYEDEGYKIDITYMGEEIIKTKLGNMRCYKVKPSIPKNNIFDGKDAISMWLSADIAQVIMRIKARLFIGSITIELQD